MYHGIHNECCLIFSGIDTETVIYDCQWKLLMPVLDSHMASTVCPHLLDLSPRNGFNWGLSCALARIMLRNLVEHLHEFTPFGQNVFDYSKLFLKFFSIL